MRDDEQQIESSADPGGVGGNSDRTEGGLTALKDARLTKRAVREGWIGSSRFPTREGQSEIVKRTEADEDINAIDKATLTAISLMGDADGRNQRAGAAIVVAMEAANQRDDLAGNGMDAGEAERTKNIPADSFVAAMDQTIPGSEAS